MQNKSIIGSMSDEFGSRYWLPIWYDHYLRSIVANLFRPVEDNVNSSKTSIVESVRESAKNEYLRKSSKSV